jgi:hypothetical protein
MRPIRKVLMIRQHTNSHTRASLTLTYMLVKLYIYPIEVEYKYGNVTLCSFLHFLHISYVSEFSFLCS